MKKKIFLKAPLLTTSGYGVHGRTIFRALRTYEDYFDIFIEPLGWGRCGWISEDSEERRYIDALIFKTIQYTQACNGRPQYDIFCHCTIPNEFEQRAPINIGITAGIESNRVAPQWVEKTQLVNKLIVVSNHAKYGFDNSVYEARNEASGEVIKDFKCTKPIEVIGYPVRKFEPKEIDLKLETEFNYLLIAQWGPRKNVEKTILWFVEENIDREDVGLVCKLNIAANSAVDVHYLEKRLNQILSKYPNRKCKVYLVHGDMSNEEMAGLYTHPKIKVAISISPEGFGLFAFEAAYYGLPVVTYAWGGPMDFLTMPSKNKKNKEINKNMFVEVEYELRPIPTEAIWDGVLLKESLWAYAKEGSFKVKLRDARIKYDEHKAQALELQEYICEKYTEEKVYHQYAEAILGQRIAKLTIEDLPKVSIVTSVFKSKEYLEECLKDVEKQTVFKFNCEHIIVHPKTSPDFEEEKKIILDYQQRNENNVKYIEVEEDSGLYGCWNKAIQASTGKYITNWNTDDRRSFDCVEKCAKELFLDNDLKVVYFDQWITDKPNETFEKNSSNGRKYNFPECSFEYMKMMNLPHAMPMWEKELHDNYGYFNEKYKSAADWAFFLECGSKNVKIKKIQDVLGLYYFSPTGISTDPNNFDWKKKEEEEVFNKYKDIQIEEKVK